VNGTPNQAPRSIAQLYYLLDKRLALIEQGLTAHQDEHEALGRVLADHESRLRSGFTLAGLISGSGGLLSLVAILKSFIK
jgi:hypothetical protein